MTEILTAFQKQVLDQLHQSAAFADFYLTGGTALSAFYLEHRYSEDLDFFTEVPQGVARVEGELQKIAEKMGARLEWGKRFQTLSECVIKDKGGESVEMDFALDMPNRLEPVIPGKAYGMTLDNLTDIAANKLSALYERSESKDFVDVFFLLKDKFSFENLWGLAQKKYTQLDLYGLAVAFFRIKNIQKMPRMVKPVNEDDLKNYFLKKAGEISREFRKAP